MTIMVRTKRADGCENDMACRKGELNKRAVHTGWPYQMALPADACTGAQYDVAIISAETFVVLPLFWKR